MNIKFAIDVTGQTATFILTKVLINLYSLNLFLLNNVRLKEFYFSGNFKHQAGVWDSKRK